MSIDYLKLIMRIYPSMEINLQTKITQMDVYILLEIQEM